MEGVFQQNKLTTIVKYCQGKGDTLERRNRVLKLRDQILEIAERVIEKLIRQQMEIDEKQFGFIPGCESTNNTISLSCDKQVCLSELRFERYFSHPSDDGRSISRNVAQLNILVHDMINLLYYEY